MGENQMKTVKVTPEVHKQLTELGKKGESYNHIIARLLEESENQNRNEKDKDPGGDRS